jgi:hypothetical protein
MIKNGSVNKTWLAELPTAPKGAVNFPTLAQLTTAKGVVAADWAAEVSSGTSAG